MKVRTESESRLMKKLFYMPLTATPLSDSKTYKEIFPQNVELAKYIRCFWGSVSPYIYQEDRHSTVASVVIPDTCVDIIYKIDHTANIISGGFCGINDTVFSSRSDVVRGHLISTFAIRFYAWGAYPFSEDSLKDTVNGFYEVPSRFRWLDRMLRQQLFERRTLAERVKAAEELFLQRLPRVRQNNVVNNAVRHMIWQRGTQSAADLAKECFISGRQMERLFHEYIGITPKKLGNLVRYQFLWNDIFRNAGFDVLDAVCKYGYTDQSHLMREFKRYHGMDIQTAKRYAYNAEGFAYAEQMQSE